MNKAGQLAERLLRLDLVVLDELGYLPFSPSGGAWHEVIGDQTYADAILDRLVHNAHRLDLDGDSMRRAKARHQA